MSLRETQNFLVRIYTDENLRRDFATMPEQVGRENNLTEKEIAELTAILPDEIKFFADSLFWKRLREVEKLLPLTKKALAADFEKHFRDFANQFTPESTKKHLEDAIRFAALLSEREIGWKRDAAIFESAKLEFYGLGKMLVIKTFDYDIKGISRSIAALSLDFKRRKTMAVWLRIGKREFVF